MTDITEKAVEILQKTNDGNDLEPIQLSLVESAVNGYLTDLGMEEFEKLYTQIASGVPFKKPFFHGLVNLTIDSVGYVYWRERQVEHFTPGWAYSKKGSEAAHSLARSCWHLESLGVPVTGSTVVWHYGWFKDLERDSPYLSLMSKTPGLYERENQLILIFAGEEHIYTKGVPEPQILDQQRDYHALIADGWHLANLGQGEHAGTCYATGEAVIKKFKEYIPLPLAA